jgi:hypothetical protein
MDVRIKGDRQNQGERQSPNQNQSSKSNFKAGAVQQASAKSIPPAFAAKLSHISQVYGLPLDLSNIGLDSSTPENVKAMRQVVHLLTANSKLLPELMKLTNQLLKADIKLAEFHKNLTNAAVKHQCKLDKTTADIWLKMAGYAAKASKLEHRTNVRTELIEKRSQAYANYYQDSVYGAESAVIDAEYQVMASNQKILSESKVQKLEKAQERKQKLQEYVNQAYV